MNKIKAFSRINLNFIVVLTISLFLAQGCGKKDGTTGDNKDSKTDSKSDNKTSSNDDAVGKPFHVIFDISGVSKGTVDAYYSGNKARSTSSIEVGGQKMSATAYFNGDDHMMYMINEIAGTKTGMKMDTKAFKDDEEKVDITNFKDKLKTMDKVGSEEILGRLCDIYKAKDGKVAISVYKETIPLKFSASDGKMVMVASKLETDVKVTDDMFVPPSNIEYVDETNALKDMKNMKTNPDKTKQMEELMKKIQK